MLYAYLNHKAQEVHPVEAANEEAARRKIEARVGRSIGDEPVYAAENRDELLVMLAAVLYELQKHGDINEG